MPRTIIDKSFLENRVDERRHRRAFGQDHQASQKEHRQHKRHKPEFFSHTHKFPKLDQE
jgi:hypothetical protein